MKDRLQRRTNLSRALEIVAVFAATLAFAGPTRGAAAGAGNTSDKSVPAEPLIGGISAEQYAAEQAGLNDWLIQEMPAGIENQPIVVRLSDQERNDLARRQETNDGPAVVGRTKPIMAVVRFSPNAGSSISGSPKRVGNGVLQGTSDGGFVWAVAIRSEAAGAIRVHVSQLDLPGDADLFFFSREGQAFGPYSGRGPNGDGDFWTNTVFGSEGILLLRHYGPDGASDLRNIQFVISDVGHIGPKFGPTAAAQSFCSFNAPCIENASCHSSTPADPAKSAVALMQWVSGSFIYTCSGGLLADTVSTSQIPYFLTANHCISTASNASNLETYFQFSIPCGSTSCPPQTQPGGIQRLGSTIKTTGTGGDYTLLQLNQTPPAGSVFLGWNNAPIANTNNAALYRISHPAWAPQAYSEGHVDTSAPTCTGWPRGQRIYSRTTVAGTEGGSSGSPVVNGSSQVVGQLSGACGTNTGNPCDNVNNATVDGAFAYYWPSVQPYLDPSGGCVPVTEVCNDTVDNDCDNLIDCADPGCSASPFCSATCNPVGASCNVNSDCCSNKCKGAAGKKTCR